MDSYEELPAREPGAGKEGLDLGSYIPAGTLAAVVCPAGGSGY